MSPSRPSVADVGQYHPPPRGLTGPPDAHPDAHHEGLSDADVGALVRLWRLAWARRGVLLALAAGLGAGVQARPEYLPAAAGVEPPPVAAGEVRAALAQLHRADSQLRQFADSSRLDRAVLHRELTVTRTALARGVCAMQTPQQREMGGLPCATLLNGGSWDAGGAGRTP